MVNTSLMMEILRERDRQIKEEGFDESHDDKNVHGELSLAAACYALEATTDNHIGDDGLPVTWPITWDGKYWKPKDRRRCLVVACALLIAELERLDRK